MKQSILLIVLLYTTMMSAQKFYSSINRLGLGADVTFFNLDSDAVAVEGETGYAGYFETRGEFNRHFDVLYSLGIFNHSLTVQEFQSQEKLDMSLLGVEVKLLLAWRVFQSPYFTLEAGPAVMINGEFKIEDMDENKFVGTTEPILASEFEKTNPININAVGGFSAGINNFRVTAHYHYSFLDSLDSTTVSGDELDGSISYWTAGIRVYF